MYSQAGYGNKGRRVSAPIGGKPESVQKKGVKKSSFVGGDGGRPPSLSLSPHDARRGRKKTQHR